MGEETPSTNRPKRTATEMKKGGGAYLNAGHIGPRGREFAVTGGSWEENYAKDALIPCLHLEGNAEDGEEDELLFKVTTKGNNAAVDEGMGAGGEDLSPVTGAKIFVLVSTFTKKDGKTGTSLQIAEVLRDGKSVWTTTKA